MLTLSIGSSIRSDVGAIRLKVSTMGSTIGNSPVLLHNGIGTTSYAAASVTRGIIIRDICDTHPPSVHEVTIGEGNPVLSSLEGNQNVSLVDWITAEISGRDNLDGPVNVDKVDDGYGHGFNRVHVDLVFPSVDCDLRVGRY